METRLDYADLTLVQGYEPRNSVETMRWTSTSWGNLNSATRMEMTIAELSGLIHPSMSARWRFARGWLGTFSTVNLKRHPITCHKLIRKFRTDINYPHNFFSLSKIKSDFRSKVSLYPLCLDLRTMPNSEYWGIAGYNLVPARWCRFYQNKNCLLKTRITTTQNYTFPIQDSLFFYPVLVPYSYLLRLQRASHSPGTSQTRDGRSSFQ